MHSNLHILTHTWIQSYECLSWLKMPTKEQKIGVSWMCQKPSDAYDEAFDFRCARTVCAVRWLVVCACIYTNKIRSHTKCHTQQISKIDLWLWHGRKWWILFTENLNENSSFKNKSLCIVYRKLKSCGKLCRFMWKATGKRSTETFTVFEASCIESQCTDLLRRRRRHQFSLLSPCDFVDFSLDRARAYRAIWARPFA